MDSLEKIARSVSRTLDDSEQLKETMSRIIVSQLNHSLSSIDGAGITEVSILGYETHCYIGDYDFDAPFALNYLISVSESGRMFPDDGSNDRKFLIGYGDFIARCFYLCPRSLLNFDRTTKKYVKNVLFPSAKSLFSRMGFDIMTNETLGYTGCVKSSG